MDQWSLTGLGMGTVFIALIGLALVVSLFPVFFRKPEKKRVDPAPLPELNSRSAPAVSSAVGPELVAVIAAAVAASSGMAPGSFCIASVAPAQSGGGFNTPVWGHVDRLSRPANHR
ncbi:MAG: OadG family protein [Spirochaetaceae bacterium]|nr:OadG family protein [Spirochaetaceae bacterium]